MPELPEVETTMRLLAPDLTGRTVTAVQLAWSRHTPTPAQLQLELPGRQVTGLSRRAKYLLIHLEPADRTLIIHLGMSGRLSIVCSREAADRYAHTVLALDDGNELRFSDTRKFGRLYWLADPESLLGKLGPEPLSQSFTVQWLIEALSRRKRAIKPLLLEQTWIAGLGNIYADESLFRAGLDPRRPANTLSPAEAAALHAGIREVLAEAIQHQGTSFDWVYPDGRMQSRLQVYGRQGDSCAACGTPIERIVLGQRGTHFCPRCQR